VKQSNPGYSFDDELGDPQYFVEEMDIGPMQFEVIRDSALSDLLQAILVTHATPVSWESLSREILEHLELRLIRVDEAVMFDVLDDLMVEGLLHSDRSGRVFIRSLGSSPSIGDSLDRLEILEQYGDSSSMASLAPVPAKEEMSRTQLEELALASRAGDPEARNLLVKSNLGLVHFVIRKFPLWVEGSSLTYEDEYQSGCLGLIRAAEKFDPTFGTRFSTYATTWIRQAISRAHRNLGRTIRLPIHIEEQISRVASRRLRYPSDESFMRHIKDVAKEVDLEVEQIFGILRLEKRYGKVPSISASASCGVAPEEMSAPEQAAQADVEALRDDLIDILSELPRNEALSVALNFGIGSKRRYTLQEIGDWMGLTRERIRQLRDAGLKRLRAEPRGLVHYKDCF
jgi:RNA polymerase sigma factor (sigma-70 family)